MSFLEVDFHEDTKTPLGEHNSIKWLTTAASHMCLCLISLARANTTASDIIALTKARGDTLGRLSLALVHIPESDCWCAVLQTLRENIAGLDSVSLYNLTIGSGETLKLFVDAIDESEWNIDGTEEHISRELGRLAESHDYIDIS